MSTKPTTPPVPPETPEPPAAATPIANKRIAATGAIPKHVQSWIFLGVIAVAAVGLWFSGVGHKGRNANAGSTAAGQVKPLVGGLTPEEVQKRLQESEDSRRVEAATSRPSPPPLQSDARLAPETPAAPTMASSPTQPVVDPIAEDERKREYVGRYASNIALSYRAESRASGFASRPTTGAPSGAPDPEELAAASPAGLPGNFQQQLEMLQAQQQRLLAQQQQLTASSVPTAPTQPQQAQTA